MDLFVQIRQVPYRTVYGSQANTPGAIPTPLLTRKRRVIVMNIIGMECATTFYPSTGCGSHQKISAKDEIVSDRIIATSSKTAPDVLEALSLS